MTKVLSAVQKPMHPKLMA